MTANECKQTLAVLIDLPSELAGWLEEFLDLQGITMRTQDCLIALKKGTPTGHSSTQMSSRGSWRRSTRTWKPAPQSPGSEKTPAPGH